MANPPVPGPGVNPSPVPPLHNGKLDAKWLNALRNRVIASLTSVSVNSTDLADAQAQTSNGGLTLTLSLATTGVTAGTYGSASKTVTITVDAKGRTTAISQETINIPPPPFPVVTTATRPAGAVDGTPVIDSSLTPPRPIYAWSASATKWIDGSGAAV